MLQLPIYVPATLTTGVVQLLDDEPAASSLVMLADVAREAAKGSSIACSRAGFIERALIRMRPAGRLTLVAQQAVWSRIGAARRGGRPDG